MAVYHIHSLGLNLFISAIFTMMLACWVIILNIMFSVKKLQACLEKFLKNEIEKCIL